MQEKSKDNKMQESASLFVKLDEIVEIVPKMPKISSDTEVSFLGMVDISTEGTIINTHRCTYSNLSKGYSKFLEGDILVAIISPCFENGKGALATGLINGIGLGSGQFHVLRATEKIDPYILLNITLNKTFRKKGKLEMVGTTGRKMVPSSFIRNYQIFLPPLSEQQKIASILRTWDRAIERTKRLIEIRQKYLILLTRLLVYGYLRVDNKKTTSRIKYKWCSAPSDWSFFLIKDIAVGRSEFNVNNNDYTVLSCSKHYGFVRSLDFFKKQIFSKKLTNYKIIYRNDFGFPSNHIEEGSIGLQNLEDKAVVSPIYTIFTPDNKYIYHDFLFRLLKTKTYIHIFCVLTTSSVDRRGKLSWTDFSNIGLCLPDLIEQKKISEILVKQENLINNLSLYKKALQNQKQGLMQKLLTGQWRVRVEEDKI
ncbi:restriction endonuclease subunit S [Rickettsia endosymbiont of Halotydeus destructor]|uniref:restriction endonuclease subunit S n=1 Tax=Rickettsia endosymbiont of Halotydeus destructor TaxID=2996754 RepID=UPI003BAFEE0E